MRIALHGLRCNGLLGAAFILGDILSFALFALKLFIVSLQTVPTTYKMIPAWSIAITEAPIFRLEKAVITSAIAPPAKAVPIPKADVILSPFLSFLDRVKITVRMSIKPSGIPARKANVSL